MQLHNWDHKVNTTLYMEQRHVEELDRLARSTGVSRQWVLREILDKVFSSESFQIQPPRVSL